MVEQNLGITQKLQELEHAASSSLIPPIIEKTPGIQGSVNILTHITKGRLRFAMYDGKTVPASAYGRYGGTYEFFGREDLPEFSKLQKGEDKYARVVMHGTLKPITPDMLFTSIVEVHEDFRRKGFLSSFQERLTDMSKKLGYRFLTGYQNDEEVAVPFLKSGRYLLEEVKPEKRDEFEQLVAEETDESVYYTIKFLNEQDIETYIKPDRIGTSVENKIQYRAKSRGVSKLLDTIASYLGSETEKFDKQTELLNIAGVLDELNQALPEDEQYDDLISGLTQKNIAEIENVEKLRELLQALTEKSDQLVEAVTMDDVNYHTEALQEIS